MHKLQMYEGLRDMLEKEVTEIEKKGHLDPQSLDNLYKLMTALKVTDKCIEREGGGESYESRRGYDQRMMPWAYDDGMSYARRDGESRDNFRGYTNRGRSNGSHEYSRDSRDMMIQKLENLMDDSVSPHERQAIMDCISKI